MNDVLRIVLLVGVTLYFIILFSLFRKEKLNLKYTLLWIFAGLVMGFISIFPEILDAFAKLVGVAEPTNALFAILSFCIIVILMSLTSIVSSLNDKNIKLIQSIAILELRVRELEKD